MDTYYGRCTLLPRARWSFAPCVAYSTDECSLRYDCAPSECQSFRSTQLSYLSVQRSNEYCLSYAVKGPSHRDTRAMRHLTRGRVLSRSSIVCQQSIKNHQHKNTHHCLPYLSSQLVCLRVIPPHPNDPISGRAFPPGRHHPR